METKKHIELRSEKVRSIIGKIPPLLLRIGIAVITGVIIIILALMYYIPYPQIKTFTVQTENANGVYYAKGELKVKDAKPLKVGQSATLLLFSIYGDYSVTGSVYSIKESNGKASISVKITSVDGSEKRLKTAPSGEVTVLITDKPILRRLIEDK